MTTPQAPLAPPAPSLLGVSELGVTAGVDDDCAAGQIGCFQAWRRHGTRRPSRRIHVELWQIAEVPISARSFVAARHIRVEVTTCGQTGHALTVPNLPPAVWVLMHVGSVAVFLWFILP